MSYDEANQKLIVAGQSSSHDVINSGNIPIIIKIDELTGGVVWHKQVDSSLSNVSPEMIQECSIQDGQQTYFIGVSAAPNFAIILLNYQTGDVAQVYFNNKNGNSLQKNDDIIGLKMDQNDMIYIITAYGNTFSIAAFQQTSSLNGVGLSGQDINFILTQELAGSLQIEILKSWSFTYTFATSMSCLAVSLNTTYFNFLYTTAASESVVNYGFVKIADNNYPVVVTRVQTFILLQTNHYCELQLGGVQ
eukprot:403370736